jgi:putative phosphoribosyl transferase
MREQLNVEIGRRQLPGFLAAPKGATGLIIFVHGSGSGRFSPRNAHAANVLQGRGFATLLFDLLTPEESDDRRNIFDITLLARRIEEAIDWAHQDQRTAGLSIGLFGASTGAGGAIVAAARRRGDVAAIVSRGGRPDLAGEALGRLTVPILLIVGGNDHTAIALNEEAQRRLSCENRLLIVPGATHLFDEPATLDEALDAATDWFELHLEAPDCVGTGA